MSKPDPIALLDALLSSEESKRFRRTTTLLIDRELESSSLGPEGWAFCVPSCFDDALDLKDTNITEDKVTTKQRTQGRKFHFKAGALIYDTPLAYTQSWGDALAELGQMVRVEDSTPANEEEGRYAGTVTFSLLKPNAERSAVERVGQHECSQDDFVRFLITGTVGV